MTEEIDIPYVYEKIFHTLTEGNLEKPYANVANNYAPGLIMSRGYNKYQFYVNLKETDDEIDSQNYRQKLENLTPTPGGHQSGIQKHGIICKREKEEEDNREKEEEDNRELIIVFFNVINFEFGDEEKKNLAKKLNFGEYIKEYNSFDYSDIDNNKEILVIYYNYENASKKHKKFFDSLRKTVIQTHNSYIKMKNKNKKTELKQHPITQFILYKKLMFNIRKHYLIPKYIELLDEDAEKDIMKKYNIKEKNQMPKINGLYTIERTTKPIAKLDPLCEFYGFYSNSLIKIINREDKVSYRYILSNFEYLREKLDTTIIEEANIYKNNINAGIDIGIFKGKKFENSDESTDQSTDNPADKSSDNAPDVSPDDKTPDETPDDGTPDETPDDKTPDETPDDRTPDETPDDRTPDSQTGEIVNNSS